MVNNNWTNTLYQCFPNQSLRTTQTAQVFATSLLPCQTGSKNWTEWGPQRPDRETLPYPMTYYSNAFLDKLLLWKKLAVMELAFFL